jgi:hypothetical protein
MPVDVICFVVFFFELLDVIRKVWHEIGTRPHYPRMWIIFPPGFTMSNNNFSRTFLPSWQTVFVATALVVTSEDLVCCWLVECITGLHLRYFLPAC